MTDITPGVPARGHVSKTGYWHHGLARDCKLCLYSVGLACPNCGRPRTKEEVVTRTNCRACREAA